MTIEHDAKQRRIAVAAIVATLPIVAYSVYLQRKKKELQTETRDDTHIHLLSVCNNSTDCSDMFACVRNVFKRARNPQRVHLHVASTVSGYVELSSFRLRFAFDRSMSDAVHTNTHVYASPKLRHAHARKDGQVLMLPVVHEFLERVVQDHPQVASARNVVALLGAPGTFELKQHFDDALQRCTKEVVCLHNLYGVVAGSNAELRQQKMQRHAHVRFGAPLPPRLPTRKAAVCVSTDGVALLHPEAMAGSASTLLTIMDAVKLHMTHLLKVKRSLPVPDVSDWTHRAASRMGYGGTLSSVATTLFQSFGKRSRIELQQRRDECPVARARVAECVALTMAREALQIPMRVETEALTTSDALFVLPMCAFDPVTVQRARDEASCPLTNQMASVRAS